MAGAQSAKAISAAANGRVHERPQARVFEVEGSSGALYTVVIGGSRAHATCNCQAGIHGVLCKHVRAARLIMAAERDQAPEAVA